MSKSFIIAVSCAALFAGCAQWTGIPSGEAFPEASLRKAKSAEHWNVIAADVAVRTSFFKEHPDFMNRTFYVVPSADNSHFTRGFQSMLTSHLVNAGLMVVNKPAGAIQVNYEVQTVKRADRRDGYQPGTLAALAGGVLVAHGIAGQNAWNPSEKGWAAAALLGGAELIAANEKLRRPTTTEIIITTSMVDGGRYVMRKTDVYYVEDSEQDMFKPTIHPSDPYQGQIKNMKVVGP